MATQVQYRRGTGAQNDAFTGALGEMTIDTTAGTMRVHNGVTAGGSNIATVGYVTTAISAATPVTLVNGTSSLGIPTTSGNVVANVAGSIILRVTSGGIENGQANATGNIGNSTAWFNCIFAKDFGTVNCSSITNSGSNGVGNIGTSSTYFNTVFAKATSAQYADLAEMYVADQDYTPGTVVEFGGEAEVTATTVTHSTAVAGIVSTNPSYLMNATQTGNHVVAVALVGRVPCQVVGTIRKGDRLVASDITGVAAPLDNALYQPGAILGKALEAYDSEQVGTIEVAVGRT